MVLRVGKPLPRSWTGRLDSQLRGPLSQLEGPQNQLGGLWSQLGGPQSRLEGTEGGGEEKVNLCIENLYPKNFLINRLSY